MKVLSKLLLGLFVFMFGFVSFSEASQFFAYTKSTATNSNIPSYSPVGTTFNTSLVEIDKGAFSGSVRFIIQSNYNCSPGTILVKDNSLNSNSFIRFQNTFNSSWKLCTSPEIDLNGLSSLKFFYTTTQNTTDSWDVQFVIIDSESFNNSVKPYSTGFTASISIPTVCPTCPTCDEKLTSQQCQAEYDLIPILSVNQNYCLSNNLCPVIDKNYCEQNFGLIEPSECPISGGTGDIQWSALFINNIQHLGSPIIRITIPTEIERDYTRSDSEFNLDIVGINGDEDYINGIISVQNYSPDSEDFTNVFMNFIPYMKIMIFVLFFFFVLKMIKKVFK